MNKILIDRSTVEQALEALELYVPKEDYENRPVGNVIDALKAALAEPVQEADSPERRCGGPGCDMTCCQLVQEPVAWMTVRLNVPIQTTARKDVADEWLKWGEVLPLYTAPPQRPAEPVQEPFALPCPTPKACKAHCCSGNCIPRSKA